MPHAVQERRLRPAPFESHRSCREAMVPNHSKRSLTFLGMLLCASCGSGSTARPEATGVQLSPARVSLQPGASLRFQATVLGPAGISQAVAWTLLPAPGGLPAAGWIDPDGTYHAPLVVASVTETVRVTSVATPAVTATAEVVLPARTVIVSPWSAQVEVGGSVQFTAAVAGLVDTSVTWETDAPGSPISAGGLFTAGPEHAQHSWTIWALNAVGEAGAGLLTVGRNPPILTHTSGPAAPGDVITLHGQELDTWQEMVVAFTDALGGEVLTGGIPAEDGRSITTRVPVGAASGPVRVEAPVASSPTHFERAPALRLRLQEQVLAPGQSTTVQLALLGAAGVPTTVVAELGSMAGMTYQAPTSVAGPVFDTIRACLTGTSRCTSATVEIRPVVAGPAPLVVASGGSIQLELRGAGGPVGATFGLRSGPGFVSPGGLYQPGAEPFQEGPALLQATWAGGTETLEVGVLGVGPGLVSRLSDPVDHRPALPAGTPLGGSWADAVAVAGHLAYVAAGPPEVTVCEPIDCPIVRPDGSPETWWIDVYDLSDPLRPRWLGASESATHPQQLFVAGGLLLAWSSKDTTARAWSDSHGFLAVGPPTLAVYDLTGGLPALRARWVAPTYTAGPPLADGASLLRFQYPPIPYGQSRPETVQISASDLAGDPAVETWSRTATFSPGCRPMGAPTARGSRLYAQAECGNGYPPFTYELFAWDLASEPPALLGRTPLPPWWGAGLLSLLEQDLLVTWSSYLRIYGLGSGLPTLRAERPFGSLTPPIPGPQGRWLFSGGFPPFEGDHGQVFTGNPGLDVLQVDLTDPAAPKAVASTFGTSLPRSGAALAGSVALIAEGLAGVGIYDLSSAGGPVRNSVFGQDSSLCGLHVSSAVVASGYLWTSGDGFFSQISACEGPFPFLAAHDLGAPGRPVRPLAWRRVEWFVPHTGVIAAWPGGLLYAYGASLEIISLADPAQPDLLGALDLDLHALAAEGALAWGGTADGRLVAIDLTDPRLPTVVGEVDLGLPVAAVELLGGGRLAVALAWGGDGDLVLVDGSTPTAPFVLARAGIGEAVYALDTHGTLAALTTDTSLLVLDLVDQARPALLGSVTLPSPVPFAEVYEPGRGRAVAFHQGLAWVGTWAGRGLVRGYDLDVPGWPRLVSTIQAEEASHVGALTPLGGSLLVSGGGTVEVDVSRPGNVVRSLASPRDLQR
ncbi:MAG: hypothetical protein IPQ24_12505 [Anaeromyxobacter sp.]|nr:hypothetical protein [Anaeromyxobacter sp.]